MMLMSSFKRSLLVIAPAAAVILAGCSSSEYTDRNYEYYDSAMVEPLEFPVTRNADDYQDAMPVPDASQDFQRPDGRFQAPRPHEPDAQGQISGEVEIREANNQRWLVMPGTPAQVWPQLVDFAQDYGQVESIAAAQGTITADEFTIAVSQGDSADSTEIFCLSGNTTNEDCVTNLLDTLSDNID